MLNSQIVYMIVWILDGFKEKFYDWFDLNILGPENSPFHQLWDYNIHFLKKKLIYNYVYKNLYENGE
jgi:hypothetical protein